MPHRPLRLLKIAGLLCLSFVLSACCALGFCGEDRLPDIMPSDFRFVHSVQEGTQPPMDYTLAFDRSGAVDYVVTVRAPRRASHKGTFEATESHLQRIYESLLAANFDELPELLAVEEGAERRDVGDRVYFVHAAGYEKRVQARFTDAPELALIRREMLEDVPEHVFVPEPKNSTDVPMRLVAEDLNRQFHRAECKVLAQAGTSVAREFETTFQALDFGYDPCEACNPTGTGGR